MSPSSSSRPPLPTASSSPTIHPPFHFPGPSSKYLSGQHGRYKSFTTGTAPVLTTEARAHRRAQINRGGLPNVTVQSVSSPPLSEYSRSPLSRFSKPASTMPHTPAKKNLRRSSSLQHSPFSDYFTDEARSMDSGSVLSNAHSTETKQLLVRMNKVQSTLMRNHSDSNREAIDIVGRKLGEIESELNALHLHKRSHAELDDSGVFMDDEESDIKSVAPHSRQISMHSSYAHSFDGAMDLPAQPVTLEQYKVERDWFVLRMQDLVDGLTTAQSELSKRYVEVRELNERHNVEMEDREMQLEQLRSENEGLRSDLGFEYSELLFLKLQMKSMEVDVDALSEDSDFESLQPWTQQTRRERKNRILSEMDRWRSDWQDVNSRFKRRRSKYGITPNRRDSISTCSEVSGSGEADWQLETFKEGKGRVTSLTIRRTSDGSTRLDTEDLADTTCDSTNTNTAQTEQSFPKDFPTDLEGQNQNQGISEPRIAEEKNYVYTEHGTQTEYYIEEDGSQDEEQEEDDFFEEPEGQYEEYFGGDENVNVQTRVEDEDESEDDDDCAITTSSEDTYNVDGEDDVEIDVPVTSVLPKTAWQELWASLHNLSGLGDEEDED
ncbi:hypothetical protein DOTSEDRAFT_40950 [Dothistroma septosporum NZE10]|uniref:Uncharacterized protein n=1 Tax=Dothistroma septosporum (strain NZE10 / CBS 128990) TaxID=675120 RepID=N1Q266_DOTSN|nr:hypothetical protein DOTSEDRAFT_40950 [Dothistroma septosporum NZE10]